MNLTDYLVKKGFEHPCYNSYFLEYNEDEEEINDVIQEWIDNYTDQGTVESEHVFDSTGLDIYCHAVAYSENNFTNAILITCYLC